MHAARLSLALLLLVIPFKVASAQQDLEDRDWKRSRDWTRPLFFETRLPYSGTGVRADIPPLRYNRAEGFVLGIRAPELTADDWERARPVGQLGYAFALGKWRVDAGIEARPFADNPSLVGTKLGLRYRINTTTEDSWKAPWTENSLAAFFVRNDFFDYYEAEGWTVYASQPLGRRIQLSVGYRAEEHRSLGNETSWSLFGDGPFRLNPAITEGHSRSVVAALDAGRVRHLYDRPRGSALRVEFEMAPEAFGSELVYTTVTADVRTYGRVTKNTTYAARVRGGFTGDDTPMQKMFTLGGVGSVRGYPLNVIAAERMVLASVEYGLTDVDLLLEELDLFGFADAAWTHSDTFNADPEEILASAGVGVGLVERKVRLELAFPLRDIGTGLEPTLWFRLYPQF